MGISQRNSNSLTARKEKHNSDVINVENNIFKVRSCLSLSGFSPKVPNKASLLNDTKLKKTKGNTKYKYRIDE
jgi:hypothetical protein